MSAEWIQFITWALIVVGWAVVNLTNNGREARKEARSAVDSAKELISSISTTSVEYFTGTENDLTYEIKSGLELLEIELERIRGFAGSHLFRAYLEFQEACTGGDFESASRQQHPKTSQVILAIVRARNGLVQSLEKKFREEYCWGWT